MIPLGAIINALGITIGSLVGLAFGARLPERVRAIVFQGLGLCVLVIGFKMALLTQNPLIVIFSIVIGSVAGEMIGLEARLIRVGDWLKGRLKSSNPLFTEGMVNASVLFCIGAMAILGSFDEGLRIRRGAQGRSGRGPFQDHHRQLRGAGDGLGLRARGLVLGHPRAYLSGSAHTARGQPPKLA